MDTNLDPIFPLSRTAKRLRAILHEPLADAYACRLWALTAREHRKHGGFIPNTSDDELETDLEWAGEPSKLIDALVAVGLLRRVNGGFEVVNWAERNKHLVTAHEKAKAAAAARWEKKEPESECLEGSQAMLEGGASNALPTYLPNQLTNHPSPLTPQGRVLALIGVVAAAEVEKVEGLTAAAVLVLKDELAANPKLTRWQGALVERIRSGAIPKQSTRLPASQVIKWARDHPGSVKVNSRVLAEPLRQNGFRLSMGNETITEDLRLGMVEVEL